eukprot:149936-Pelagomonas_calceolata.AAC.16
MGDVAISLAAQKQGKHHDVTPSISRWLHMQYRQLQPSSETCHGFQASQKVGQSSRASPEVVQSVVAALGLDLSYSAALLPAVAQDNSTDGSSQGGSSQGRACVLSGDALIALLVSCHSEQSKSSQGTTLLTTCSPAIGYLAQSCKLQGLAAHTCQSGQQLQQTPVMTIQMHVASWLA